MEPGKEAADTEAPTVETADENNYPGGVKLLLVMVAISLNVFVVAMVW